MTRSNELAPKPPSNVALVRRYRESIASSSKDVKRGEQLFLDKRGRVIDRAGYVRVVRRWKAGLYAATFGGIALFLGGAVVPGAAMYSAAMATILLTRYRGFASIAAIELLIRQGHLDEAQRRLDAVPSLRRRNPAMHGWLAGAIASNRGEHAAALKWWTEALPRTKGVKREILKLRIVKSLLLGEQLEPARRELDSVVLPPGADEVITGRSLAVVMLAQWDAPTKLPSEDDLHDWARRALEYSHTGVELGAIGWAFEKAGNDDMAHFLASEAVDRMHNPYLATWWPALHQWLDGRLGKPAPE